MISAVRPFIAIVFALAQVTLAVIWMVHPNETSKDAFLSLSALTSFIVKDFYSSRDADKLHATVNSLIAASNTLAAPIETTVPIEDTPPVITGTK